MDRVIQPWLERKDFPDFQSECLNILVQVSILYFYILFDVVKPEFVDAFFHSGPPSDNPAFYVTAHTYFNATELQLQQLASGDLSLLTESQLEAFENRHDLYEQRQAELNSKWYHVRFDLILFVAANIIFKFGF
jgi:hypothetical protein